MAIPRTVRRQRDFSAGQINENAARRSDIDIFDVGLKTARNVRLTDEGSLTRRPGRKVLYFDGGKHDLIRPISTQIFDITFADGTFTARLQDGGIVSQITGCPWDAAILETMTWEVVGTQIYIADRAMAPVYIEYDPDNGAWTLNNYTYRTLVGGRLAAPFYRFADYGVTMNISGRTGSITLTTSADVFVAAHVGLLFTYMDRQVQITAVNSATQAVATVLEELPPTFRLTLDNVEGFSVGETVEGDTSNTVGEITFVDTGSNYIYVTVSNNYSGFDVTATEYIVADEGRGKLSAQSEDTTQRAILQWKEVFISAHRGWPGSVSFDAQRLIFCDFPQLETAVLWSAIDALDDLDSESTAIDAAILTFVPQRCRVYQVVGFTDQIVLTDIGPWYVPISETDPLIQGSARFKRISSIAAGNVHAIIAEDACLMVGAELNRLFAIRNVGQTRKPYEVTPLTDWHSGLFSSPRAIAVGDGSDSAPGRHMYVVNSDGTLAVGRYRTGQDFVGWYPWDGEGLITDVVAKYGSVRVTVDYGSGVEAVEEFDTTRFMDGEIDVADGIGNDIIAISTGEALAISTGEELVTDKGAAVQFVSRTMYGWADGFYVGPLVVDADGKVTFPLGYTNHTVGWLFTPEIEPFIPTFEGGEDFGQADRRRKVARVMLTVRDTTTFVADGHSMGHQFAGYKVGDDMSQPRPLRDDTYRYRKLGRSFEPRVNIQQPIPGNFTLIELTTKVTI